eukprot:CAMPEP_0174261050 /NCGR_PEP_ID=MMETSP0439-20130205/11203_1 /TAXON_ID=0 /ORGANISM="Stereomyxa ramosa, Strain Chinc5" /LENGTH=390 /DNA_ID=CAMNT_0015345463 /DNA_START=16 /DNA_END=1184 /DNA_ORIENTATION=+
MSGRSVFIVAAKRTAFGTFGGKLKSITATDLGVHASKGAIAACGLDPEKIDTVIYGNVCQTSTDACYLARHIGLKSGTKIETPALTVNRLCGSGFQSIVNGAHEILLGEAQIALVGGTENMSQAPYAVRDTRWGTRLGVDIKMEDTLWAALTDSYVGDPMAITAENLGAKYNVTRADCDAFALQSQQTWKKAAESGAFDAEIVPIELKGKKGKVEQFAVDEHPRSETTIDNLAKLPPVFKKDGLVTAGNASGICDGAASLILASEEAVKAHNLKPLARLVSWGVAGVDPKLMGIGPSPAIRQALSRADLSLGDMDRIEVNEAFAAQAVSVCRDLEIPVEKINTNGGAIALGHPLAASGARITAHLVHDIARVKGRYAVGSACIGGGQGLA